MDITDTTDVRPSAYRSFAPLRAAPASRRRVWTVFAAFVGAVGSAGFFTLAILFVFVGVMAVAFKAEHGAPPTVSAVRQAGAALGTDPIGLLGSGLAACLSFALFALVPASLSEEPFAERLRLVAHRRWFAWGLVAAVGMLGVGQVSSGLMALAGLEHHGSIGVIERAFDHAPPAVFASALLIIGVGAGVGEELFFRGYMQTRLARRWRPWVAVVVTAALFGLVHFDVYHSAFAFCAGLLLGWVSLRAGSVRPTIVAHVANNAVSVVGMALTSSTEHTSTAVAAAEIALGVVFVGGCVLAFRGAPQPA